MKATKSTVSASKAGSADSYRCWHDDAVRFGDIDPLWHLTSTAYLVMFENARILFLRAAAEPLEEPLAGWMLVNANINSLSQVHYPDAVRIGTRVGRIGRTSVTTQQSMFKGESCAASLDATLVLIDDRRDRAVPIPDDLRANLEALSETGVLA